MDTRTRQLERVSPRVVVRARRRFGGGSAGNAHLTALAAAVLIVLLAVEGATIPFLGSLLTVHIFVGMLLLGPVALKLGATGYRFARYYSHAPEYVRRGPPAPLMRLVVAPVLVLSTLTLFGTGVALLLVSPGKGNLVGLHKASFIVWFGAMTIHVLVYVARVAREVFGAPRPLDARGTALRYALILGAVAAGVAIAVVTLPLASPWLHWNN